MESSSSATSRAASPVRYATNRACSRAPTVAPVSRRVADLPVSMQVKLLRAIQEKSVRPVGGASEEPVDIPSSAPVTATCRRWSPVASFARTCSIESTSSSC